MKHQFEQPEHLITLKSILHFDRLREEYSDRRIKLRFNTSWYEKDKSGRRVRFRDLWEMYKSGEHQYMHDSLRSLGKEKKKRLSDKDIVFQFIEMGAGSHRWLLIDVEKVISAEFGTKNSSGKSGIAITERLPEYAPLFGRLIVKWTNLAQQFYYVDKDIVDDVKLQEILPNPYLEHGGDDFEGYEAVCKSHRELKRIIEKKDWVDALGRVYGVYVITDTKTGKLYVGSACGDDGIYGRWSAYLKSGYDKDEVETGEYPNKKLRQLVQRERMAYIEENFQYSILEIFPKSETGKQKALKREAHWKQVLQTRLFGYNDN